MSKKISVLIAMGIIVGFAALGKVMMGTLPAIIFTVASTGGFVLWMLTTYKTPVDPQKIIVPYLLSVILFIAHVYEEYITDFEGLVSDISGVHVLERDFLTVAAFIAPVLWLVGAVLLLKRTDIGYYLLSFFFVGMTVAELSHFVFPFLEDGTSLYVGHVHGRPAAHSRSVWPLYPCVGNQEAEADGKVSWGSETSRTGMRSWRHSSTERMCVHRGTP